MEMDFAGQKRALRQDFRKQRLEIPADNRALWDEQIFQHVVALPGFEAANTVFTYISHLGEVSTEPIIDHMLSQGKKILVPSPDLRAMPSDGLYYLRSGENGHETAPCTGHDGQPESIDMILVPGIVWDQGGYRIGFGGGYFDRLMASLRPDCLRVGLAFSSQVVERVPRDGWDMAVHVLVTENGPMDVRQG